MGLDKGGQGIWLWLGLVLCLSGAGVVAANEAPMAEAGLDQTVEQNATVYLDAGGSQDPDGTVEGFTWTITAPNGTTFSVDCADCERTDFRATRTGSYEVTVTVTDDGGATKSDTMYVTVERGQPPGVQLSGPTTLQVGEKGTVTVEVSEGDDALSSLVWTVDGDVVDSREIDGPGSYSREVSFSQSDERIVRVEVVDALGRAGKELHKIRVKQDTIQTASSKSNDAASRNSRSDSQTEPGVYFDNNGEVVGVRYGTQAQAQDLAFRLGGATISGRTMNELVSDDGQVTWNEVQSVLLETSVRESNLLNRAKKYTTNCNPQSAAALSNCRTGKTVDVDASGVEYASTPESAGEITDMNTIDPTQTDHDDATLVGLGSNINSNNAGDRSNSKKDTSWTEEIQQRVSSVSTSKTVTRDTQSGSSLSSSDPDMTGGSSEVDDAEVNDVLQYGSGPRIRR